jgi:hypothetical protein
MPKATMIPSRDTLYPYKSKVQESKSASKARQKDIRRLKNLVIYYLAIINLTIIRAKVHMQQALITVGR